MCFYLVVPEEASQSLLAVKDKRRKPTFIVSAYQTSRRRLFSDEAVNIWCREVLYRLMFSAEKFQGISPWPQGFALLWRRSTNLHLLYYRPCYGFRELYHDPTYLASTCIIWLFFLINILSCNILMRDPVRSKYTLTIKPHK